MITYSITKGHWNQLGPRVLQDQLPFAIRWERHWYSRSGDTDMSAPMDLEFELEEHLTYFLLRYADLFGDLK